jgi:NitT/TauT family transport system substrate-binding protein
MNKKLPSSPSALRTHLGLFRVKTHSKKAHALTVLVMFFVLTCFSLKAPTNAAAETGAALRVGHFPNITHAQAVIGHALTDRALAQRSGKGGEQSKAEKGWFEKELGTPVEWYTYNAGPSAMEALLAGSIDVSYVGPNPALNAYVKSKGTALKVISGSAFGGSALVVRKGQGFTSPESLKGKKVGTPQFGNTQDVSARSWFKKAGLSVTQTGGDVFIIPTANPDQLALFLSGDLDAVWTVEPWVSRLENEAGGEILLDEASALTTVVVASTKALKEKPEQIAKFLRAHRSLTQWIKDHTDEAQEILNEGLKAETSRAMPIDLVKKSWGRITFSTDIKGAEFTEFLAKAQQVGFLQDAADVSGIVEATS